MPNSGHALVIGGNMLLKTVLVFGLSFTFIGCGSDMSLTSSVSSFISVVDSEGRIIDTPPVTRQPQPQPLRPGLGDAPVFEAGIVNCPSGNCPQYIGGLFMKDTHPDFPGLDVIESCSGTLIAKDLFLTNKHCLASFIREKGASCRGIAKFSFPATSGVPAEDVGCHKVYDLTNNDIAINNLPDWAILQLDRPVNRTIASIKKTAVRAGARVNLHPVYFSNATGKLTGEVRTASCQILQEISKDTDVPFIDLTNCGTDLIVGNSGSGIFYEGGLAGVFSHLIRDETSSRDAEGRESSRTAQGTSVHIIRTPQ